MKYTFPLIIFILFLLLSVSVNSQVSQLSKDTISYEKRQHSIDLNEVIVTALGIRNNERSLGYAVTSLSEGDIDNNALSIISALQGKVAGLDISGLNGGLTGRMKISIRGASTLKSNNQPLIIIDGVTINSSIYGTAPDWDGDTYDWGDELKNLNPADIENISVLKGAAATALYGSRGINGAIVITTKNVKPQKGLGITFSQSIGFDLVTSTPKLQRSYGPGTIAGDISYGQKDSNGNYRWDTEQFYLDADGNPTLIGADGMGWGPQFNGQSIISYDGSTINYFPQSNSYKDFYDTGLNCNTNIIIQGGNDKTTFYLSGGYRYAEGTLPENSFDRTSFMLKGSHQITSRLNIRGQVSLTQSKRKSPQSNIGDLYINRKINQLYDSRYYRNKYKGEHGGMANSDYEDEYANVPVKDVWWQIYENKRKQKDISIRPSLAMNIKILDWLDFDTEANMSIYTTDGSTDQLGQGYANEGFDDATGGWYRMFENKSHEETYFATFNLRKNIQDFSFDAFVRGEYRNANTKYTNMTTNGGLETPGIFNINNSRNTPTVEHKTTYNKRVLSFISAVNAGWKDQIYLAITGRNDWSSALVYSNGTGNYSYFYPSISTSWIASETFRKELPSWVSFGKFRLSWAQVGNDTDPFYINSGYTQNKYLQSNGSYIYTNVVTPTLYGQDGKLKPERKNAWELGTDWRFLNGRIGIDITLYKENTKDQIMSISLPKESGVTNQIINAGNIQNKGIEIALNTTPVDEKDWQWNLGFTYSRNRNKIVSLHSNMQEYITLSGQTGGGNYRVASVAMVGGDYGILMSDIMPERDDDGNLILTWDDECRVAYPKRSTNVEKVGKITPDFTGSVSTGIRYKNFNLRALFDFRYGGLIASYSNRYGHAYGLTESSLRYRDVTSGGITWTSSYADSRGMQFSDGVIPDGVFAKGTEIIAPSGQRVDVSGMSFREAYEKNYVEPVHASDYHFFNNGWSTGTVNNNWINEVKYIAVREISLSYKVPANIAAKFSAKSIDIHLSARNLGYLYNSLPNNLHPESVAGTATTDFRERGFIPYTASFMGTITLGF